MHVQVRATALGILLAACGCTGNIVLGGGNDRPLSVNPAVTGTVPHRLNRLEYNLTVRDLLGTTTTPADAFPGDPASNGFDDMAANLTLSPSLMGQYHQVARALANEMTTPQPRWTLQNEARTIGPTANAAGSPYSNWGWLVNGNFSILLNIPQDDAAMVSVIAAGQAVNAPTPLMKLTLDGQELSTQTVSATTGAPAAYNAYVTVTAGQHTLAIVFTNPNHSNDTTASADNELIVGRITLASTTTSPSAGHALNFTCDPNTSSDRDGCWQDIALNTMSRAWRRPLTNDEQVRAKALWKTLVSAQSPADAYNMFLRGVLVSSNFLYRTTRATEQGTVGGMFMDDYDLANRLSYFLWASMPDAKLLADAQSGALRTPDGIWSAASRMLADPKASGLLRGFVDQWLETRALSTVVPDPQVYPSYDKQLAQSYVAESELFFKDYLTNGQSVATMPQANFSYLNDRLAKQYGVVPPGSATPVRVTVESGPRHGLLGQGGWLTATSLQTRTSPVKRGRFIMEQLLCSPIPAPPPNTPVLSESTTGTGAQTMRQILEQHVSNATCASCHNVMDPPGLGLENFDGVGAWRTLDAGQPIDASGTFGRTSFNGPDDLAKLIADDPRFVTCLSRQLYAYALGRALTSDDSDTLADIGQQMSRGGNRFDTLVRAIVTSEPFRLAPYVKDAP